MIAETNWTTKNSHLKQQRVRLKPVPEDPRASLLADDVHGQQAAALPCLVDVPPKFR